MKNPLYAKVEQFVAQRFEVQSINDLPHLKRTAEWARALDLDIDEAFLIAAVSHDIERSDKNRKDWGKNYMQDPDYLTYHQERGGEIMAEFLQRQGAEQAVIDRVYELISKHEVGGNADQNFLKDVDSLSFFENNVAHFMADLIPKVGKEEVGKKFDWMFERITSEQVRELARPFYEEALARVAEVAG